MKMDLEDGVVEIIIGSDNDEMELMIENTKIKTNVKGTKQWEDGPQEKPNTWFKLYRQIEDGNEEKVPGAGIKKLIDGATEVEWTDLDKTDINGNPYIFSIKEVDEKGNDFEPANYTKSEDGLTVTNKYIIPTNGEAKATKIWVDGPQEKPTIWFKLYRQTEGSNEEEVPDVEIKELIDGVTEVEWTGLEETDIDGNPYTFLVKEVDGDGNDFEPENYTKTEDALTVTNTYVSPKIEITGTKIWENGPKPEIELQLYRQIGEDGKRVAVGNPVVLAKGKTTYTWEEIDLTDKNGVEYIYTIDEIEVPENYTKTISEDGLTITNEYTIPSTQVKAIKKWVNGPREKPSIKLQLYRNGKAMEGEDYLVELPEGQGNLWTYTWYDLDATDIDGNEYTYTVDEVEVPEDYEKEISDDGLTITNTFIEKPGLPKTGESSNLPLYIIGSIFILLGFILRKRIA
ncbi:MAG: Cna B-type domain-containing protein [Tissierellia bacterium]|nr:Cna B-type domain-containing protein [Tissierellia bacterium]